MFCLVNFSDNTYTFFNAFFENTSEIILDESCAYITQTLRRKVKLFFFFIWSKLA